MAQKWGISLSIVLFVFSIHITAQESNSKTSTKQALLIGTFHYHNPGADVAKTKSFDILSEKSQTELETITQKIKAFDPNQIFVEWPYDEQEKLDSLYQLYLDNKYFTNDSLSDFYLKNEIFQLAFRAAKKSGLKSVKAIDYRNTEFPFDSLMTVVATSGQTDLQNVILKGIESFSRDFDEKIEQGISLLDLTYHLNSEQDRQISNLFHTEIPLLVGNSDNFIGPYLTAEWYRRNLYMWSLIQKGTRADDQRVMVLLGASHIALIKDFVDKNTNWNSLELEEVMKQESKSLKH
ncbi:hypothetical protein GTQ34_10225 [Muricauda sp. JGD-17]|uniref:TraB/GumN family protein n=1 Tax=Flagellimonas ochracea TaxID=2696472 RepID=A0A964TCF4_9FLAO|nr:DUF5694 domain-containing protein [Allomuricauda ochracea]NAY92295.1 hypothetical protein [Allomuricauda ochracea]